MKPICADAKINQTRSIVPSLYYYIVQHFKDCLIIFKICFGQYILVKIFYNKFYFIYL